MHRRIVHVVAAASRAVHTVIVMAHLVLIGTTTTTAAAAITSAALRVMRATAIATTAARTVVVIEVFVVLGLWRRVRNKYGIPFYDVIFTAQRLRHFWIQKCDKTECSERLRYEDIGHFAELRKIFFEIIGSDIFGATTDKHFAR